MRRSSWILLLLVGVLLVTTLSMYSLSSSERAPVMTLSVGREILEKGRTAMESGDTEALLALFTRDAIILGRKRDNFRQLISKTFSELHGNFRVTTRNLEVVPQGQAAEITFTVDIGQRDERMDAVYFPDVRMRAKLQKSTVPRWLGLLEREEWKVTELTSDPQIIPKPVEM